MKLSFFFILLLMLNFYGCAVAKDSANKNTSLEMVKIHFEVQCEPCSAGQLDTLKNAMQAKLDEHRYVADTTTNPPLPTIKTFGLKEGNTWFLSWLILSPSGQMLELSRARYDQGYQQLVAEGPENLTVPLEKLRPQPLSK